MRVIFWAGASSRNFPLLHLLRAENASHGKALEDYLADAENSPKGQYVARGPADAGVGHARATVQASLRRMRIYEWSSMVLAILRKENRGKSPAPEPAPVTRIRS